MSPFSPRRDPLKLLRKRALILLLLILVAAAIPSVWDVYKKEWESRALRVEAESMHADLTKRRSQLETDLSALRTDRGMEAAIRMQYQLARSGEKLIVIVEPPVLKAAQNKQPIMEWFNRLFRW